MSWCTCWPHGHNPTCRIHGNLTAVKPSTAPTAEALVEVAREATCRLHEKLHGALLPQDITWHEWQTIEQAFLAALKSVAPPAGQEKMREALERIASIKLHPLAHAIARETGTPPLGAMLSDCVRRAKAALSETPQS